MIYHIEITDEPIEPGRPYTDKQTGMQKMIPGKQKAYLHGSDRYPIPFKIEVQDTTGPLRPGKYLMGGGAFAAGEYDRLKFDARRLHLIPLEEGLAALTGKPGLKVANG